MTRLLISLFGVFAPLSLVTIGGGQSAIAEIHRQVVDVHHWMTEAQFVEAFAISRMAPGPGSLLATLIGWHVAGISGAIVATIGIFAPTAFLIYGVAHLWMRYEGAHWQRAIETGLRPVAAGMLLASAYILINALEGGFAARAIALAATVLVMMTRVSPFLLIFGGATVFVGIERLTA